MGISSSYLSNESGADTPIESKTPAFVLLLRVIGKVMLAGIGFLIGCFLGLLVALYTGLLEFSVC